MREIKFRTYNRRSGKMVIVCQFKDGQYFQIETGHILMNNLMQFTGLLDKNGKEIYEGDIVEYNILGGGKVKMVVAWDIIFGVWEVKNKHTEELLGEVVKENENFEVIGNIYENKDLLS